MAKYQETALEKYVGDNYNGEDDWVTQEVAQPWHVNRIQKILEVKEYLSGRHKILNRPDETYNGNYYNTRKIILQLPKTLCNFETSFLLKNPVTLTSENADTLDVYKSVYRKGRFNSTDYKLLDRMVKYGEVYEYLYLDNGVIKSRIIPPEDSYPVFDNTGSMIAFIEHYMISGISYYTLYEDDSVSKFDNEKTNDVVMTARYSNLSGLPIQYKTLNELDNEAGRSSIEDYVTIVDALEDLLSKYTDALHKYISGIPVMTGEKLKVGKKGEGKIDPNAVGYVLQLEMGSEFDIVQNKMDSQSFRSIYSNLMNHILLASQTPAIALNQQELSNISESSIRMTYSLATVKARANQDSMMDGFVIRWAQMKQLLQLQKVFVDDEIDCNFEYDIPFNSKQIIEDVTTLKEHDLISTETALSRIPYVYDVTSELEKLEVNITE